MTVPDELVQAVHDAAKGYADAGWPIRTMSSVVLDAVPDGWAKMNGEWRQIKRRRRSRWLRALETGGYSLLRRNPA